MTVGRVLGNWPADRVLCALCDWRGRRRATVDSTDYIVRIDYGPCARCHHSTLYEAKAWAEDLKRMRRDEADQADTGRVSITKAE